MDFDRIDEDNNDLLGNPNFYKPTQSSANVEVIKCLAKIGVKEGLVNNEAFYIIGSFVIIELGMTAISFIHGIKSVAGFVKGLLGNSEGKSAFNSKRNTKLYNSLKANTAIIPTPIWKGSPPRIINGTNIPSNITAPIILSFILSPILII